MKETVMRRMLPYSEEDGVNAVVADWVNPSIDMENVIGEPLEAFEVALQCFVRKSPVPMFSNDRPR